LLRLFFIARQFADLRIWSPPSSVTKRISTNPVLKENSKISFICTRADTYIAFGVDCPASTLTKKSKAQFHNLHHTTTNNS
jgi:hypothetical protein